MPSSSTHNTSLERKLTANIRIALIHLHTGGQEEDFNLLASAAKHTLDIDSTGLDHLLQPAYNSKLSAAEYEEAITHLKYVEGLWKTGYAGPQSARLESAGQACADVALELALLLRRGEEARGWADEGQKLLQRGQRQFQLERRLVEARKARLQVRRREAEVARARARGDDRAGRGNSGVSDGLDVIVLD